MPGLPNKPVQVLPIKLYNNTGTATPIPFQQMITYDVSGNTNIRSDCANVWFTLYDGSVLKSWLEAVSGTWWIVIPNSIIANSSVVVYMNIGPATDVYFDGITIGCAPQLSATYGEYDNGANVFSFYDNFAGTTLKSSWSEYSTVGTITVNNGLTLSGTGTDYWGLVNSHIVSVPNILECYSEQALSGSYGPIIGTYTGMQFEQRTPGGSGVGWGSEGTSTGSAVGGSTFTIGGNSAYNVLYLVSGYYVSSHQSLFTNYSTLQDTNTLTIGSSNLIIGTYQTSTAVFQWVRTRAYPPNGVMPYALFPQPKENLILADAVI